MALSNDLISQFVKATKPTVKQSNETTLNGTTVEYNGSKYVKLDGSDLLTPVNTTADTKAGERVTVMIKNHTATVTGNLTSPAARTEDVKEVHDQIAEFDTIMAYKVTADNIEAMNATIENLKAKVAKFSSLTAVVADIETLQAKIATIDTVNAKDVAAINAEIENIQAKFIQSTEISADELKAMNADITTLKGYTADFTYVSAEHLTAAIADIKKLDTEKLSAEQADLKYANIDFANINEAAIEKLFSESGIIKDLVVSEGHITGELVGVTIKGDLIEGGTVKADKLVVLGTDGLYYKLNTDGVSTTAEQTEYNSLNGSVITAKTITAEKVNVNDLVAFGATIGGFNISESSLYSGVKSSVDNTTTGVYLDKDGQIAFGDMTNFIKYYKNADGKYVLEISADAISIQNGETRETISQMIDDTATDLRTTMSDANQETLNSCVDSINKALDNYVRTGDYTEYKETVKTQLEILSKQIEMNFTTTTEEITTVDGEMQSKFNELSKYIRFSADGIELGETDNPLKLAIDNDIIRFEKDGATIGWWDGVDFHTGNMVVEVQERAQFGNFAFIPRSDGSLMFLKVNG